MGGSGSGNYYHWRRPTKKTVVEDCRQLDANRWTREGILQANVWASGGWYWKDSITGEQIASLRYEVSTTDPDNLRVRLSYTLNRTGESLSYTVGLQTTRPVPGGVRWWFTCPLVVNDVPCCRRVGKLYLPPGGRYYGCRHCYRLTYRSCQDSHKDDHMFRLMARPGEDPADLRRTFNRLCRMTR